MEQKDKLLKSWLQEEELAHIHGWDFSHLTGRYEEEGDLPWSYEQVVRNYLTPEKKILDIDTGGGEFLLSLQHPYENTAATENYPPNVELCKETLLPLGIDFKQADGSIQLPFADESFDIVLNRHGEFNEKEIYRVLKPNGIFITQQVGAKNDRELVELLLNDVPPIPFPKQHLHIIQKSFEENGFHTLKGEETFRPIRFFDVGALVWFARVIPWEFPNFSVETCLNKLYDAQKVLEEKGVIEGNIHRFLLVSQKI